MDDLKKQYWALLRKRERYWALVTEEDIRLFLRIPATVLRVAKTLLSSLETIGSETTIVVQIAAASLANAP